MINFLKNLFTGIFALGIIVGFIFLCITFPFIIISIITVGLVFFIVILAWLLGILLRNDYA